MLKLGKLFFYTISQVIMRDNVMLFVQKKANCFRFEVKRASNLTVH